MPRVLVAGKLHPSGLELLKRETELTLDYVEEVSTESLEPMIYKADALLIRTQLLPADIIEKSEKLKIVSRHGVGYDTVDVDALNKRNIPLTIVSDVNSRTVAEHAMMLMLAAGKRLLRYNGAAHGENWNHRNSLESEELYGKTLLILGFGRIGRHLARMALVFGMKLVVHDPFLSPEQIGLHDVEFQPDLKSALEIADFVSVHVPKTDAPLLGAEELRALKSSAIVINTARGGVIDENALVEALTNGQLAGAGMDVFEEEPPPAGHPFSQLDQVILTPHSAGMTRECAERMAISSAQNIIDFFGGKLDRSLVVNAQACGMA